MYCQRKTLALFAAVLYFMFSYSYWYSVTSSNKMNKRTEVAEEINKLKISPSNDKYNSASSKLIQCTNPVRHFVFVRTHKTGSSTVRRSLSRYAKANSIETMTCGEHIAFFGGYPGRFEYKFNLSPHFEAIDKHFRFNPQMSSYMPKDTKYFTVIREPWSHFQSCINFHKSSVSLHSNCHEFPHMYLTNGSEISIGEFVVRANSLLDKTVPWYFRFKNYQSHDLGLDPMLNNEAEIDEEIKKLESQLDLFMIMEYMDESLVLLKDLLCADWNFISLTVSNARSYEKSSIDELSSDEMKQFNNLQKLDIALYSHFNASLWKKVDEYGRERMEKDIKKLRRILKTSATPEKKQEKDKTFYEYERITKSELAMQLQTYGKYSNEVAEYMMNNSGGCFKYTDKPLVVN